jgi:alpha-L-rhamnosidase
LCQSVEVVVYGTDMEEGGDFSCSDPRVSHLFTNIRESMKGNMSYPQRDERLRRRGELALFAPLLVWFMTASAPSKTGFGI